MDPNNMTEPSQTPSSSADESQQMAGLLVLVAGNQDRTAFMQIYGYFAPRVKGFLVSRGLTTHAADDVLQEVMMAIWNKAGSYDPAKAAVSTWIFTIARYKYIDRLRRESRHKSESDDLIDLKESDAPIADDNVLQDQRQNAVQAAIANLPADQQSVIFLSFIKGLAHSEIAEQLGLPLGTVKSRIRRAFARLREELGEVK
jgi:RNA polymerase sigma-70 factor (ECF subfamily)